jgi:hypothetical protein
MSWRRTKIFLPVLRLLRLVSHLSLLCWCVGYPGKQDRLIISVADPGSCAFLTPGSGIGFFRISDPGSQTHIFESLVSICWEKVL